MYSAPTDRSRSFLRQPALKAASGLLGGILRHDSDDGTVAILVTEVEAYESSDDPGSHAYRGRTARNASMFGDAGHLYCYLHLGLHHCANIVCQPTGQAAAVLIRAGLVIEGSQLAHQRRTTRGVVRSDRDLARGPGRLTVALGLDHRHDGLDLLAGGPVTLVLPTTPVPTSTVGAGPRVGVSGAGGDGARFPWRFWIDGDPTVSAYRAART
ncbi:DNA-3-methyladenine glycosylase [Phytoactinopolyspora limicola]|uniref:DNA-3-methyladenine glycosylase n=1 Tax=Phytoactinopolyspora limicola TaxID=2715536 RepID=UPI00140E33E7|nr:DNA-3-methyladenine glycosylase [Phytoactinopolyspora limicola]